MVLPPSADKMIFDAVKQTPVLVVICAWCRDSREQTVKARESGAVVSHGICSTCFARFVEDV